ncbi:MAG: hypothetical protein ACLFTR_02265 [Candidatus Woesearchaeota archaeon]
MDIGIIINFFAIFVFIGFVTDAIWGLDMLKLLSDGGAMLILSVVSLATFSITRDPGLVFDLTEVMQQYFVNQLAPMLIGDFVGTTLSKLAKRFAG